MNDIVIHLALLLVFFVVLLCFIIIPKLRSISLELAKRIEQERNND